MRPPRPNTFDGDAGFTGVDQRTPPALLPAGMVADAQNARFRFGKGEPRRGVVKLPWTNRVTSPSATSVPIPFGRIYGAGRFRDEDDNQWGIIAAEGRVFRTRESNGAAEILLPPGVSITQDVTFTQTQNGLVMFRGHDAAELIMATLDGGFAPMMSEDNEVSGPETENPTDGTDNIPNAARGEWIGNRLFIPYRTESEKDLVAISDYLNATLYAPIRSEARINQGSDDELVRILKFGKSDTAICFKGASIYALNNVLFALEDMALDEVTSEYGLAAARAAVNVGKEEVDAADEVWFLARNKGICRIAYDRDGRLGVATLPVSEEIHSVIERINWAAVDGAAFELWDNKFYGALPLDDAKVTGPNILREVTYSAGSHVAAVVPGATYRWTKGANDTSLTYGTTTLTDTGEFTVGNALSVTLAGSGLVTAELQRVFTNVNNAVVVYDFVTGKWCGVDTGSAIAVREWLKLRFNGEERLFFLGQDGFINLVEWAFWDEAAYETLGAVLGLSGVYDGFGFQTINGLTPGAAYAYISGVYEVEIMNGTEVLAGGAGSGVLVAQATSVTSYGPALQTIGFGMRKIDWTLEPEDIQLMILTRAYRGQGGSGGGRAQRCRATWASLALRTWYPEFTLEEVLEGVNEDESTPILARTRSRTRYTKPWDRPAWDETNRNLDHRTPHREDYAVPLSDGVVSNGDIVAGIRYYVESQDVVSACAITYNGVTVNGGETFLGVSGETTCSVDSGTPLVYPPGSYVYFDEPGIDIEAHQAMTQDLRLRGRGTDPQLRLTCSQGRVELCAVDFAGNHDPGGAGSRT